MAFRIARHLALTSRANGIPCRGINVLMLWSAALDKGYASRASFRTAAETSAPKKRPSRTPDREGGPSPECQPAPVRA